MPKSSVIMFQTLPPSFLPANSWSFDSQPTNATHHLLDPSKVDFSPVCWRLLAPRVIFYLFGSLFEPLKWFVWQHFKYLWWSFPQPNQKFQVYLLLCVYCSFLSVRSWMTWKDVNKSMWKKNAKISYILSRYHVRWLHNLSFFCL